MTLRERLQVIAAQSATKLPPADRATMAAATDALRRSGILDRVLKAGDHAPDFTLFDEEERTVALADLRQAGPVVVSFYRGVWCPYCNADLKALEEASGAIRDLGAALVAISPQTPANSRKAKRQNGLSFPILSDPGNEVAAAFGLRFTLAPEVQALYKGYGAVLPAFNGDESWTLPMPARFVVRLDGTIASAEADPDYTRRPEPDAVLDVLRDLDRQRRAAA